MGSNDNLAQKLSDNGIIEVNGYIDSQKASEIVFRLLSYNSRNSGKTIQLYFASENGSYLDMMAIYDTIRSIENPVSGICVGFAGGYSALLLASCTKGMRYALKHSKISIEQPYGMLQQGVNQQTEISIEAEEVAIEREIFEKALALTTGQKLSKIHNDCELGIELSAESAVEYGIIDKIIE